MNTRVVDLILPIMLRQRDTQQLGLVNIKEYHHLLSRKRNRLKRVRYVTTFKNVIITFLLMSLPS